MCLFIVCETMFMIDRWITSNFIPMQMTQKRKHNKWLQFLSGEDFSPKPLWSENADLKFSVNNEGEDVNTKPPEQREHRLAQRRQRLEIRFILWKTQIY